LWGSITVIAALIPNVGTAVIMAPAIAYLAITGDNVAAIGLAIWAATAVGLVDNLLGPALIGKGASVHPLLILLSVLGGLSVFGTFGFIFGPLAMSLFLALLQIYTELLHNPSRRPAISSR
jgi:predicted PurR-regulated permease PerM